MIDPYLPLSHQGMFDPGNDLPEVPLDENGEPVVDEDSDEDMFDYVDER